MAAPPVLGVARDRLVGHLQLTPPWTAAARAAAGRTGASQDAGLDQLDREGRGVAATERLRGDGTALLCTLSTHRGIRVTHGGSVEP